MTTRRDPERLLSAYLADGMEVLSDRVVGSILDEVHVTRQRPGYARWSRRSTVRRALAAAAAVTVVVLGGAFYLGQRGRPGVAGPSATPVASPGQSHAAVVIPSGTPSTTPSATPIAWSAARLAEDWPAPVRLEPAGGAPLVPIFLSGDQRGGLFDDPTGDTGSPTYPWVDIHSVGFGRNTSVLIWVPAAPGVNPTDQWIAYGVVVDDNGDGIADRRFGMDNIPGTTTDWRRHRAWITDLHTGRTVSSVRNAVDYTVLPDGTILTAMVGDTFFGAVFPFGRADASTSPGCLAGAEVEFGGGDTTGGGSSSGMMPKRYYAWASVIVDGRVAATDYAPDAGWLHPSASAPKTEEPAPTPC